MKIIALNGSPRLIGNTTAAINVLFDELEKQGFRTEHVQMYGSIMTPCNDCGSCVIRGDGRCINEDDDMNGYLDTLAGADGIILAAPSYYGGIPGQMRILLERITASAVSDMRGNRLARKIGCAVAVQSRDGGMGAYSEMVNFMLRNEMTVCGSYPLTILTGTKPSEILNDKAGIKALRGMGAELGRLVTKTRS
ncbi:MAG: flavodoxin family protein [Methanomassiliicoccaceae archaeon]|jgi:multimeric flavodoxin WrbA|nr:flavodoxin family protein [Methanomassiliicoccaceae archaeon]